MSRTPIFLLSAWLAGSCAATEALSREAVHDLAEASSDGPVRLTLRGTEVVSSSVPVSRAGLPERVRTMIEAIAPGGTTLRLSRERGPLGEGYRVEKDLGNGDFRAMLIAPDGSVLERSHAVPLGEVPQQVLLAATAPGRIDVRRCEIVSDGARETGWRILVLDGAGRAYSCECSLDGDLLSRSRILDAEISCALPAVSGG
ncbi:MAG: hypothetical protein Fur0037_21710 [Planctomycetota bacterium]